MVGSSAMILSHSSVFQGLNCQAAEYIPITCFLITCPRVLLDGTFSRKFSQPVLTAAQ